MSQHRCWTITALLKDIMMTGMRFGKHIFDVHGDVCENKTKAMTQKLTPARFELAPMKTGA